MKKRLIPPVAALLCAVLLCGCQKGAEQHTISNYDSESNISVTLSEDTEASGDEELTGDFSVKEKIYDYEGRKVALLDVTNNTNKDLAVTVTCTFLDGQGNGVAEESQSFGQYSAGYRNYFLFDPGVSFEKLSFELEIASPTEPMYAEKLVFGVGDLRSDRKNSVDENGNLIFHPSYNIWQGFSNGNDVALLVTAKTLYFGEDGEILTIVRWSNDYRPNPSHPEFGADFDEYKTISLDTDYDKIFGKDQLELPEEWQTELTTINCILGATEYTPPA